jgi:hypothetical protein
MDRFLKVTTAARVSGDHEPDLRQQVAAGESLTVGKDEYSTIAPIVNAAGFYPWREAAAQLFASSDSVNDTGLKYEFVATRGGIWQEPYAILVSSVELNGQTPVELDVHGIQNVNTFRLADGQEAPEGTVYVYAGLAIDGVPDPELTLCKINNKENLSLNCCAATPANAFFGLSGYNASAEKDKHVLFRFAWRSPGSGGEYGSFKVGPPGAVGMEGVTFKTSLVLGGPGTQVELRAIGDQIFNSVTGIVEYRWLDHL